ALPEFVASRSVDVIASLPCYRAENVEKHRGRGVYNKSIEALCRLNAVGYGHGHSGLALSLVYNLSGAHLPPPQAQLEADYKRELGTRFGIYFNHLYTLTGSVPAVVALVGKCLIFRDF